MGLGNVLVGSKSCSTVAIAKVSPLTSPGLCLRWCMIGHVMCVVHRVGTMPYRTMAQSAQALLEGGT